MRSPELPPVEAMAADFLNLVGREIVCTGHFEQFPHFFRFFSGFWWDGIGLVPSPESP